MSFGIFESQNVCFCLLFMLRSGCRPGKGTTPCYSLPCPRVSRTLFDFGFSNHERCELRICKDFVAGGLVGFFWREKKEAWLSSNWNGLPWSRLVLLLPSPASLEAPEGFRLHWRSIPSNGFLTPTRVNMFINPHREHETVQFFSFFHAVVVCFRLVGDLARVEHPKAK